MSPASALAEHPLRPLLQPRSIAFVGASAKPETIGNDMVRMCRAAGFIGTMLPVNPTYREIDGLPCFPSLSELPAPLDHAVLAVANHRLEAALDEAIAAGAKAATIFGSCILDEDGPTTLARRIAAKARKAGLAICGGNCMGFYNLPDRLRVIGFPSALDMEPGGITWIAQSGSAFGALAHNDRRLSFNLAISTGAELATTAADYLDWALEQETTRVVGLFLETVRDPQGFTRALEKAAVRDIPVVVLKVGRTARSARMALSHTGAIVGSDAAFGALLRRHGATQVDTLDELASTLLLFAQPRRPARGGLVAIHDSGGERELAVDLAERHGVPYAQISPGTAAKLAARLDPGLEPDNPLDAWGTGHDYEGLFTDCFADLLNDDDAALGILFGDVRDGYYLSEGYCRAALAAAARSDKPVAVATNYAMVRHEGIALRTTRAGVPVLDGTEEALRAARHMMERRRLRELTTLSPPPSPPASVIARWRERLGNGATLDEAEGLDLLDAWGVPTCARAVAETAADALAAARRLGFPVAVKTATPGILHKSDVGGVQLGLADPAALVAAYDELATRLGPRVLVMAMAAPGVELGLGAIVDAQFGPYVVAAAGGVLIELLDDRAVALAPLDTSAADRLIGGLKLARLLDGARGRPKADRAALANAFARLSVLARDLADMLAEIDINPMIAGPTGCVAVDALIVPRRTD
jgi:acyl-CoA synthetase (NDP forming)